MITSLEKVKTVLQISGTDKDDLINTLIPLVENDYIAIRNQEFDRDDDNNIIYPFGAETAAIKMIEFLLSKQTAGVKSEGVSRYSVNYEDNDRIYPKSITKHIKRRVSFS